MNRIGDAAPSGATETVAVVDDDGDGPLAWKARLMLAFGADGVRGPEWLDLRVRSVELGRDVHLFRGGPLADARMSRRHFGLRRTGDGWVVEDLASRNGVWLNGRKLQRPTPLAGGDVLRAGGSLFVFVATPDPAAEDDDHLVGRSGAASAVRRALQKVAPHDTSVLLTGETGTGKEVAALYLHNRSGRSGPFIAVNCAALSPHVLESELFGHRKGSFTGAADDHKGLFRAADGGTLLLDEVGELPAPFQAKLLRVLETGSVRPVGDFREVHTDTRVVAATNRDLLSDVRGGRFRADLYSRLAQWPIAMPSLSERREDIPLLMRHALGKWGGEPRFAADLAESLMLHPWPLNVRGLVNVINIATIASPEGRLELGPEVQRALEAEAALSADESLGDPEDSSVPDDSTIDSQLKVARGRVASAARSLGLSRQQVYRWLEANDHTADDYRD